MYDPGDSLEEDKCSGVMEPFGECYAKNLNDVASTTENVIAEIPELLSLTLDCFGPIECMENEIWDTFSKKSWVLFK